ncbi:enoyl-CoA hydratase/isomerase family protein [Frankia sp. R82]|uniref:enoyl-CoA hydratase/isomerase family protein n=1 Tax=Frankia sp. R82 TaxID=2950553 RepID=UPI002042FA36|nr:enoyl-CoA hydratase/isomerase family protein [Frankia sp. R82]MCM3886684.1 enoyl-CoA hydratase/isomerase family protein [Frankia sp. R82]
MAVPAAARSAAAGLQVEVVGPVARVRLHGRGHPDQLGAFGVTLGDALRQMTGDVRLAVMLIDGSSPVAIDTAATRTRMADSGRPAMNELRGWRQALDRLATATDLISIAAVSGWADDLGTSLAAVCDLRIFAADAGLRLDWAARLGLLPAAGALADLVRLTGAPTALDLSLTARPLGATEALRIGLAQRVVPPPRLETELAALAAGLLAVPAGIAAEVKALLRATEPGGAELLAWERLVGTAPDLAAG